MSDGQLTRNDLLHASFDVHETSKISADLFAKPVNQFVFVCSDILVFAFTLCTHHSVHGFLQVILQFGEELIHGLGELSCCHTLPAREQNRLSDGKSIIYSHRSPNLG